MVMDSPVVGSSGVVVTDEIWMFGDAAETAMVVAPAVLASRTTTRQTVRARVLVMRFDLERIWGRTWEGV
jgi:hypothetical protein